MIRSQRLAAERAAERMTKTGNYFEDFKLGAIIRHATPRTVTVGDASLYTALYGTRFAVQSSDAFARAIGYPRAPIDDLLVFHIVFGKTGRTLAQRGRQSRLCRLPVSGAGVSRRHALRDLGGDRPQGELEPQDRDRLCALDRLQRNRCRGARLCALGDGAQARRERAGASRARARSAERCGAGARQGLPGVAARRL